MLDIRTIVCGAYAENAYLVSRKDRTDMLLIDPGDDLARLRAAMQSSGKDLSAILLTHGHFDHMLAAAPIAKEYNCPVYAHTLEIPGLLDAQRNLYDPQVSSLPAPENLAALSYENSIDIAGIGLQVLLTPGHTQGSVCLYAQTDAVIFTGDTLFLAGYGRVDLFGGSAMAMRRSLKTLFMLPDATRVFPGHGADTTIYAEKARYGL